MSPLILAGYCPCSFVDYPGRLAVTVFAQGCNLRCRYCHNPSLVSGRVSGQVEERQILEFLAGRQGRLDGLVVTGGEPMLQPALPAFLACVKRMGFLVKLDTNGTSPECLGDLLAQRLLDFVAIDLKVTGAASRWLCGSERQAYDARRCLDVVLAAGVDHELRTTVVAPVHDGVQLTALTEFAIGARRWCLQRFRPGGHLDPATGLAPPAPELLLDVQETARGHGLAVVIR